MKSWKLACVAGCASLTLAACGSSGSQTGNSASTTGSSSSTSTGGPSTTAATATGSGKKLTVWLMTGEITAKTYDAVNQAFEAAHPGTKVDVQIQQWSGISSKLTTALASNNPPDLMEIGNTDVPEFAASGGLLDLSSSKGQFQNSADWLTGLSAPAEYQGKLYAAPLLAGDRVVIYNKQMFQKAGIASAPTSMDQLMTDGQTLMKTNASTQGFSALYLPGQYWYAGLSWLWDHGGQIATQSGGKWQGALASANSVAGLTAFKQAQNSLSAASSRGVNTNSPDQDAVMASGKAAMVIGGGWEVGVIEKDNPALKGQLGAFALPSMTAGQNAPVFLGGSDLAVTAHSANTQLAVSWAELMTNNKFQTEMQQNDGLMPNNTTLLGLEASDPIQSVFYQAAKKSDGTPASPGWATIENDKTMENLFQNISTGTQSVQAAAQAADSHLDQVLNQGS
jgi:N,N'-diacetylchitobiose transport system substrate-binding protein